MAVNVAALSSLLIDEIFSPARFIADSLSGILMTDGVYGTIPDPFVVLRDGLNQVGEFMPELPSSIAGPIREIAKIVNVASTVPGRDDACKVYSDSRLREWADAGWTAVVRETNGPSYDWAGRPEPTDEAGRTAIAGTAGHSDPNQMATTPPAETGTGYLGGKALADALGVNPTRYEAFNKQLERQRRKLGNDSWTEVSNRRPKTPQYLYRSDSPELRELAAPYTKPKPV
jgi:hypothetical protein